MLLEPINTALHIKPRIRLRLTPTKLKEIRTRRERERAPKNGNGASMDDTDLRGGSGGRSGHSVNSSLPQTSQESLRIVDLAHTPTLPLHRSLRRFPAPRYVSILKSLTLFGIRESKF